MRSETDPIVALDQLREFVKVIETLRIYNDAETVLIIARQGLSHWLEGKSC